MDTKDNILKTAYDMFLYNNYEAVTINSIIKATNLTKGAIYHYYSSKEELFKAVVEKYMIENRADTSVKFNTLKEYIQYSIDLWKGKITKLIADHPDFHNEIPLNYLSLMVAAHRYCPNYSKIGNQYFENQMNKWVEALNGAIDNEEIRNDIDIEATTALFLNIGSGINRNMIMGGSLDYALDIFEKQYWELYKLIKK